jgi:pyruvate dehydrogenase E2 component (dihydrolipoamide acetyltransferase)
MPTQILMPALSPTMGEGKLAKWLVKEGDKIKAGNVIAEIETDKATMEVEAVDEGTLARILVPEGTEKVRVNTPIAVLLADGESSASLGAAAIPPAGPSPRPGEPARPPSPVGISPAVGGEKSAPAAGLIGAVLGQSGRLVSRLPPLSTSSAEVTGARPATNGRRAARVFASPLARRLAREAGIDLAALRGSGPHGRIIKRDIEAARSRGLEPAAAPAGTAMASIPPAAVSAVQAMPDDKIVALYDKGSYEVIPHDTMRKIIAQRLTQSKQTVPHYYLSVECRLDELLGARERLNAVAPKDGPRAYKLSVNDIIIKALALALQQVPAANATWTEAGMLRHKYSDIGVAVAVEGGLLTPVIRHAEMKSLSEISNEMKDLAERARRRRLAPHEYQGGTTAISNLGMYGVRSFDAVINPPHATILAVGAAEKRAVVVGDRIEVATMMSCTLSCDHRVVDGVTGATLLNAFKALIEDPVRMLV